MIKSKAGVASTDVIAKKIAQPISVEEFNINASAKSPDSPAKTFPGNIIKEVNKAY